MKRKHLMKLVGWVEHLSNLGFAKNSHPIMEGVDYYEEILCLRCKRGSWLF